MIIQPVWLSLEKLFPVTAELRQGCTIVADIYYMQYNCEQRALDSKLATRNTMKDMVLVESDYTVFKADNLTKFAAPEGIQQRYF
ncbi:hypothetical protein [Psychromonas aquimarina]|uniref:hypothetical protein n=1 Tax=Psychromonas aquimarina TaxID=444919 RepID=UPI000402BF07|nr:hypothetical protein [Psychromonas aquimarina]